MLYLSLDKPRPLLLSESSTNTCVSNVHSKLYVGTPVLQATYVDDTACHLTHLKSPEDTTHQQVLYDELRQTK